MTHFQYYVMITLLNRVWLIFTKTLWWHHYYVIATRNRSWDYEVMHFDESIRNDQERDRSFSLNSRSCSLERLRNRRSRAVLLQQERPRTTSLFTTRSFLVLVVLVPSKKTRSRSSWNRSSMNSGRARAWERPGTAPFRNDLVPFCGGLVLHT